MTKILLGITALATLSTGDIYAQSTPIQTSFFHQFRNSDNGNGSVSVDRWNARGSALLIRKDDSLLTLGFRYSLDRYDFNNTTANWGAIHNTQLGLAYRQKINDQWLWANYTTAGTSAEEGSNKGDGFVFNNISIADYKVNDKLTIGSGFGISNEIDRDLTIFPIIAVNWQINDEWKLSSGSSDVTSTGASVYLEYTPKEYKDKWMFTSGFSYGSKNFKLAPNAATASSGEENLASAYLAASYRLECGMKVSAVTGYYFYQSYSTFDNIGNEMSKENLDDAPFVGISLGYSF